LLNRLPVAVLLLVSRKTALFWLTLPPNQLSKWPVYEGRLESNGMEPFEKVRENGRVISMAVLIAVGARSTGEREVVGVDVAPELAGSAVASTHRKRGGGDAGPGGSQLISR
jgi:hypothetical protein